MVSEAEKKRVGALIRHRRQVLDLDQPGLAKLAGVSRQTVSKWETGLSYPLRYAGKIEAVLGISLAAAPGPDPREQRVRELASQLGFSPDEWAEFYWQQALHPAAAGERPRRPRAAVPPPRERGA